MEQRHLTGNDWFVLVHMHIYIHMGTHVIQVILASSHVREVVVCEGE